jgi:TolB-like protein/DNA-binding winged helix-turn-helix (wHTH) protein/Tfp pilus assembly protein PilF
MNEIEAGSTPVATHEAEAATGCSNGRRFVFADFEVDLQRGSLARGGEEIALRPKSFAMLLYLLEHAGQLVSRADLLDAVWPGVVVTDDSVAQCLIELRRALGDDDRTMIRTVPRRGLIFEVPVEVEGAAATPVTKSRSAAARHGWKLAAGMAAMAVLAFWWVEGRRPAEAPPAALEPTDTSIAVLRFTDLSPAGDNAWLADGLSEEIMHRLAQSPSLRVIARVSSFAVEGLSIASIAEQLDVSHVLEGSLRRQGDAVRVTAQLIDTGTSSHIWSRTYDRELDNIIDLQEEIALAVADSLHASLTAPVEKVDIDPRAYERFLEARYFYFRRAEGDLDKAQARVEEAVAISSGFARAWAMLSRIARVRVNEARYRGDPAGDIESLHEQQRQTAEQALRYGATLPEVQIGAANYYFSVGEEQRAAEHFEMARALDPDHHWVLNTLGNAALHSGRLGESLCLNRRILRRDPLNLGSRQSEVQHLIWAGRLEEAQAELDRILELAPSPAGRNVELNLMVPLLQFFRGEFEEAAASMESVAEGTGRAQRDRLLALIQHALGSQSESDATLSRLIAETNPPWNAFYAAEVHAWRGEGPEAFEWLNRIDPDEIRPRGRYLITAYYSPFLAKLEGTPAWDDYRSSLLQLMRGDWAVDPDSSAEDSSGFQSRDDSASACG